MEGVNGQVLSVAVSTHVVRICLWLMLSDIWRSSIIFLIFANIIFISTPHLIDIVVRGQGRVEVGQG